MMVRSILSISLLCFGFGSDLVAQTGRTFRFQEAELRAALDSLVSWYSVPLIYLDRDVAGKTVSAECRDCSFEEAFRAVIENQALQWRSVGTQVFLQTVPDEPKIQSATLAGSVTDSVTGQWVVGAHVVLREERHDGAVHRWGTTNQFGFYSLRNIKPGNYTLSISSIGYHPSTQSVTVQPGEASIRNQMVHPQDLILQEVVVEGERSVFAASEGISRGIYVRATPSDQNQYFIEGARIYNPTHFGGVVSTFSTDALRDVQVVAGGVPPYYGGRIGGILDVTLRSGKRERVSGSLGIGSLASSLLLEGPLYDRTTFVASGRVGYPYAALPHYRGGEALSDLRSSELMTKIAHPLGNSQLLLSGYFVQDGYRNRIESRDGGGLTNDFRWGNRAINLRWVGVASPSLFFNTSAVYTSYGFDLNHRLLEPGTGSPQPYVSDYRIENAVFRGHAEYFYDEFHTVQGGVELIRHQIKGDISDFSNQLAPHSLNRFSPWELSVYFQDQWRLVPSVSAELGARATSFTGQQGTFSAFDPRFSILVSLQKDWSFYGSFASVTQFIHPYRHSGVFLFYPSIFFYPSTDEIRPSTSLQISFGLRKSVDEERYTLSLDSYYRVAQRFHEFVFDVERSGLGGLSDALLHGEGSAYGADLAITKRTGSVTGSIRYSLSWTRNRFIEVNQGRPYAPRFGQRQELYASLSFSPFEDWSAGVLCLLVDDPRRSETSYRASQPNEFGGIRTSNDLVKYMDNVDLNGGQLPGFQRLEFRLAYRFALIGVSSQAMIRLLNGYGLLDPYVWELQQSNDRRLSWRVNIDAPDLFPLYPVLSVNMRF